jgi:phytanoyl-CoA hydroxylase
MDLEEINKTFSLRDNITEEQVNFYSKYGFIHFDNFIDLRRVETMINEIKIVQKFIIDSNIDKINGIPIKFGFDQDKNKIIQRLPFTNKYSTELANFYEDKRFEKLKSFFAVGFDPRLALYEKDGVVTNYFLNSECSNYKQMGWHTDGLREFFMGKKVLPMINIGIYLTQSSEINGGLRIIPGTHRQSVFSMLTKKMQFLNTESDKNEFLVRAEPGDLVLHDGRIWHRVAKSPHCNKQSLRIVMYVSMICGKVDIRNDNSKTPLYHKANRLVNYK